MPPESAAEWLEACSTAELPPGERKLLKVKGVEVALFNLNGTVYAINNRCPHRGGPLIRGCIDDRGGLKCPMHGWRFELCDGTSPRPARATVYPVKVGNGILCLRLPPLG